MLFNQGGLLNHGVCPSCGYCPTCGQSRQCGVQMPCGGAGRYPQGINPQYDAAQRKYQEMMREKSGGKQTGSPHQENR